MIEVKIIYCTFEFKLQCLCLSTLISNERGTLIPHVNYNTKPQLMNLYVVHQFILENETAKYLKYLTCNQIFVSLKQGQHFGEKVCMMCAIQERNIDRLTYLKYSSDSQQ